MITTKDITHNKGTPQDVFASLVALVMHPLVIGLLGIVSVVLLSMDNASDRIMYLMLLVLITVVPAALYLLVYFKGDVMEMLELVDREARLIPYILMIIGAIAAVIVLARLDAPRVVFITTLVLLANEVVLGTLNFWTKVSIHTATPTFTAITLGYLLNPAWYALLFLIPLIGWARIYRKRHTFNQVTGGAFFAALITIIVLALSQNMI